MFEDQFLNDFIDNAVNRARNNIQQKGKLETEDAIPLMLKSQFNHIAHLEMNMLTKTEFESKFGQTLRKTESETAFKGIDMHLTNLENRFGTRFNTLENRIEKLEDQFQNLKERLSFLQWTMGAGFTFLGFLMTYISFFK